MGNELKRRGALVALIGLVVVAAAAAAPIGARATGPTCRNPGQVVPDGPWTVVHPPTFPDSSNVQAITAYAVDPANASHLLVTNGTSVLLSTDGGCNWANTFTAPTTSFAGVNNALGGTAVAVQFTVTHVAIGGPANADLVLDGQTTNGTQNSHYLQTRYSSDGGSSWSASTGLPVNGEAEALAVSGARPTTAYLSVQGALYWSNDGGASWSARGSIGGAVTGMTADESAERDLFLWRGAVLFRSQDGGNTSATFQFKYPITTADISNPPGHGLVMTMFLADRSVIRSTDGGTSWFPIASLTATALSAVHGFNSPDRLVAVTDDGRVMTALREENWTDISPANESKFADAQSTRSDIVYVRTDDGLARSTVTASTIPTQSPGASRIPPGFLGPPGPATLTPSGDVVDVRPGSTATVNYTLTVPHRYLPVDIYFLVDTTGSVGTTIDALQQSIKSIITGLTLARVDVRLGLAEFKDYPMLQYGQTGDVPYTRRRDLGPADSNLVAAVDALQSSGGGDNPEAQLAGLYQSATGAGQGAPGSPTYIAPGQQADFRPNVERVIMLATDSAFHRSDTDPTYPGPSFTSTVDVLKQRGIKVVGLSLGDDSMHDLRAMALATGAVASQDVDCNGEGRRDVVTGNPLVCPIDPDGTHLAAGVLGALGAVFPAAAVAPAVSAPGGVVRSVDPPSFGSISLGIDHALTFTVTYGCSPDQEGKRFPVALHGTVDGAVLSGMTATATVACSATAAAPPPPGPVLKAAAAVSAPPPVGRSPSPPPPASPSLPPPAPEPQLSPQVNMQLQVGAAHQEQERVQFQVATIGQQKAPDGDVQLAFTAHHSSPPTPYPLDAAAIAVAALGLGWLRSRHRTRIDIRPAYARINRRNR